MASLICGSLAFDSIMTFEGRFAEQILPDQLHILNVSFLVPALRRDFGGCAGQHRLQLENFGWYTRAHGHGGHRWCRVFAASENLGHFNRVCA